ncbi:hypothetical protein FQN53_000702 [Emmonsiellopsis sp. PD_33]|nr:hypothetical protein FQN53_000702 [Emmonsiellopsis sp. PD_33]
MSADKLPAPTRIALIGSGTIGLSFAALHLTQSPDVQVTIYDTRPDLEKYIEDNLPVLLFVLWYCHKRGREVRLEKERILTEQEIEKLNAEDATINASETMTTTAAEGSTIDQVRAGVREAQAAREAALLTGPTASDSVSVSSPASEAESQSQRRRPIPKI